MKQDQESNLVSTKAQASVWACRRYFFDCAIESCAISARLAFQAVDGAVIRQLSFQVALYPA
jgi:hypothetical protein